ncbi:MAG: hypothetical protein AAF654_05965 [Myxococcota bacterium]
MNAAFIRITVTAAACASLVACGDDDETTGVPVKIDESFCLVASGCDSAIANPLLLSSVVINGDGSRVTFVQIVRSLDEGPFDNSNALEIPGNAVVLSTPGAFYVGETETPTWARYLVDENGRVTATGRLTLLRFGARSIGFANTIVNPTTAVTVITSEARAVVWNPETMMVTATVDIEALAPPLGYTLESFTTTANNGLVYIPGRYVDWVNGRVLPQVTVSILDPAAGEIIGTAVDERCASGGRVVFDAAGYGYVMGDGRNYSSHLFAALGGTTAQDNCLLRIPPNETDFEQSYYHTIPSLTGGLQSITELEGAAANSGVGFAKMFYPDRMTSEFSVDDPFAFWDEQAHRMWRIELGDTPTAQEVTGIPFSTVGFSGSAIDGRLYTGESPDGVNTDVYETNPATNSAVERFKMQGLLEGIYPL